MIFKRLTIKNFGKIHDKTLEFSQGINILYGENESGKSTIHTFVRSMLYGITRQRDGTPEMIFIPGTSRGRIRHSTVGVCGFQPEAKIIGSLVIFIKRTRMGSCLIFVPES